MTESEGKAYARGQELAKMERQRRIELRAFNKGYRAEMEKDREAQAAQNPMRPRQTQMLPPPMPKRVSWLHRLLAWFKG